MGLEQVLQEVQAKAAEERTRLEAEARTARDDAVSAARAGVEDHRKKALDRASREILRLTAQEAASTELELKREDLQMERELLDRALKIAQERLKSLPRERNEGALKALLKHHEREGTHFLCAPRDELFLKMATSLKHAGPTEAAGGLVITNADGTVRIDLTYETLMREIAEKSLKQIHQRLFGSA